MESKVKDQLGYSVENARSAEQVQHMMQAAAEKKCVFCDINFEKNRPLNKQGELDPEGKDWPLLWVWVNPFPQEYHALHLIIIPRRHINNEEFFQLSNEEWLQILDAWKWAHKFFNIPGGGFVCRFGERSHNAGTIGHLHFQLQIPDGTGNVKATFFKDKSPIEEARRANRKVYSQKGDFAFGGFVVYNAYGDFLNENFHWELTRSESKYYVHIPEAMQHIMKIFSPNEVGPSAIAKASFSSWEGTTILREKTSLYKK